MNLLNGVRRIAIRLLLMVPLLAVTALGCGPAEPERTEDPEEIEKLRQEHLEHAQREMQEAG